MMSKISKVFFYKPYCVCIINRTLPENDIEWIVTEDGQFRMSWLKKVAAYDEDARVTLWLEKILPNGTVVCHAL